MSHVGLLSLQGLAGTDFRHVLTMIQSLQLVRCS